MNIYFQPNNNIPAFKARTKINVSRAELQGYLNQSKKLKEIAEILDTSTSWVSTTTAKRGLENKRTRRLKALKELPRLIKEGADLQRIMSETGLSRRAVAYSLNQHLKEVEAHANNIK